MIHNCRTSWEFLSISRDAKVRETAVFAVREGGNELNEIIIHISNVLTRISITALLNGDDDNVLESIIKDQLALSIVYVFNTSRNPVSDDEEIGSRIVHISIQSSPFGVQLELLRGTREPI